MVVALRAAHRESHPGGCDGVRAIEGGFEEELIVVDAAFAIRQGLAVETCCDAVVYRWRPGRRSPATCSIVNLSKGMSRFSASMTH